MVGQADRNYDYPHNAKPFNRTTDSRQVSLSSVVEDFDPVIERIATYIKRLNDVTERLVGPRVAESAAGASAQPGDAMTLLAKLQGRRHILVQLANYLEHVVDTLEGAL